MKLHAEESSRAITHGGKRACSSAREPFETLRKRRDLIAVTHPHGRMCVDACKQQAVLNLTVCDVNLCATKLAMRCRLDHAAEEMAHQLHAVADAEHWNPKCEDSGVAGRRSRVEDTRRSTRKNDAFGRESLDLLDRDAR